MNGEIQIISIKPAVIGGDYALRAKRGKLVILTHIRHPDDMNSPAMWAMLNDEFDIAERELRNRKEAS